MSAAMRTATRAPAVAMAMLLAASATGLAQVTPAAPTAPTAPGQGTAAATAASITAKAEQDVLTAERARFVAMVKADAGDLDKLLGPELSYTHSNAQVQDKNGFIADIKSGVIKYVSIEPTDTHAQIFDTTAVVTGIAAVHVIQNGNDLTMKLRYTNIQLNRRGSWQMVAWQATRVP